MSFVVLVLRRLTAVANWFDARTALKSGFHLLLSSGLGLSYSLV
jgi:hypothetical protein